MNIEIPSVADNMQDRDYFAYPAVSNSAMCAFQYKTPWHYQQIMQGKGWSVDQTTQATFDLGHAVHLCVLQPDLFDRSVACGPKCATRAAKEWKNFAEANDGKILLKPNEFCQVMQMGEAVRQHPVAQRILSQGRPEQSLFWTDRDLTLKARLDWVDPVRGIVGDLKTVREGGAESTQFAKHVIDYHYHVQAAHYIEGFNAVYGTASRQFYFIVVEKSYPYHVGVRVLDPEFANHGWELRETILDKIAGFEIEENPCLGYPQEVAEISLPPWMRRG